MSLRLCVSGFLLLLGALGVHARNFETELHDKIRTIRSGELVNVIVRCADRVEVSQFKDRDKKLRRERLTTALKSRANLCDRALQATLRSGATKSTVLWTINGVAATVPAGLVDRLTKLPGVDSVTLDAQIVQPAGSVSPSSPSEWNLQAVRAPELWALGHDGRGVVIASMDTGVDPLHPDIGSNWRGGSNSWFDPNGQHATPHDAHGHGTWTMGLMVGGDAGGSVIGVAPGAQWIAVKLFDDSGQSLLSRVHQGFQWLLDPDDNPATDDAPDIVNNSWYLQGTVNSCNTEFAADIAALKTAGIAVVFAGGNTGPNPDTSVSPSNDPQSVAVGAVDASLTVGDFSGRGASACDGGIYPGIVAPGASVRTTDRTLGGVFPNSYRNVSGTSFAAPHLSGGMALLKGAMEAQGVPVTVSLLESAVAQTAADLGPAGPDNSYGAGLLDVMGAYDWLLANAGTPQPGQLQLSAAAYNAAEAGGSITITVTRVGGTAGDVGVAYATADATATAGADYGATSGALTLLDGETSKTFAITILDDAVFEGNETLSVNLSAPTGGATLGDPASALLTIIDNDPPPRPDVIFADSFESGNFSAWTAEQDGEGDLNVTNAAALIGGFGMAALIDNTTGMWVRSDTPVNETRYRARFYFDPNSIAMASGDTLRIMVARSADGIKNSTDVVRIELRRNDKGFYQVRAAAARDPAVGGYVATSWYIIKNSPDSIEFDWRAATAAGANNGSLSLWTHGTLRQTLSNIDSDTLRVESVRLGPSQGIDTGTRGTVYFDAFDSRRTNYIGP